MRTEGVVLNFTSHFINKYSDKLRVFAVAMNILENIEYTPYLQYIASYIDHKSCDRKKLSLTLTLTVETISRMSPGC